MAKKTKFSSPTESEKDVEKNFDDAILNDQDQAMDYDGSLSLLKKINNPLWVSVSEAAKLGGVQTKTIRRAIKSNNIRYKIIGNRYLVDLSSLIFFLHATTKLKNKLNEFGLGQYVKEWEE